MTPQIQARNLANIFRSLARTPYVAAAVSYELQDSPGKTVRRALDAAAQRKPAFAALAQRSGLAVRQHQAR